MNQRFIATVLITVSALLTTTLVQAADTKANTPQTPASQAKPAIKIESKSKAQVAPKLVDINNAAAAELKKLPGIGDAEASKIIAGRPYGSKAWLVTKGILPEAMYPTLKDLVIAKQPFKDAAKNAELYKKKEGK